MSSLLAAFWLLASSGVMAMASAPDEADAQDHTPQRKISAESGNPLPVTEDQWRFSIAFPMIWAPDIDGRIRGEENIDFNVPFSDILDSLSFGMMFELYANRGPFGLTFRSNLLNTTDESARSGIVASRVETDLVMGVHDLAASFRVHPDLRLLVGARYVHARLDVNVFAQIGEEELLDQTIRVTDDSQLDWLVGINYNHFFNDRWGTMVNADWAIAGDNDRNYSFDVRALYRISDLNNLWFGWRRLTIGNDARVDGTPWQVDLTQSGPTVGWAFTFR